MTTTKNKFSSITQDEEDATIASSESGEWVSVGGIEQRRDYWQKMAQNTLDGKRRRITISVPERDLMKLKSRAAEEGMPYQTLINSVLHKYLN